MSIERLTYSYKGYHLQLRPGGQTVIYDPATGYMWDVEHTIRVWLEHERIEPNDDTFGFLLENNLIKFRDVTQGANDMHVYYNFVTSSIGE